MSNNDIYIKTYAKEKKKYYKNYIAENKKDLSLLIFQVGDNEASNRYVKNKIKDCEEVGIKCELLKYDISVSEDDLINDIELANARKKLTGIIVQLPLPKHISKEKIKLAINPEKDVDGFHPLSKVNPATPQGIITYLEDKHYNFKNCNAVVIGRSNIVSRPIAKMLLDKSANVSVIHSKTSIENKRYLLRNADLIICATGYRNTISDEDLGENDDALIIDVGINFDESGKMVGDCENVSICKKTAVPGGVGLLTRLAVIENLIELDR